MARKPRQFSGRWFRVYDEAIDDPKLQMLSDKQHRFLFTCWCLASKHGGALPPVAEIAWRLRTTDAKVAALIADLNERGLLDRAGITFEPHNWQSRQFQSDVSTPRVRAFRERHRNGDETFPKQDETVTETAPEQSRAEHIQSRAETDVFVPQTMSALQHRRAPSMAEAWQGFDFEDWFEAQYTRHPKKGHRGSAMRNLSEVADVESAEWREKFESRHQAWCKSKRWTWNGGAAAPWFDEWILDNGWNYEPPNEMTDEQKVWATL